jgi:3-oxoadipate enol-lactonase
VSISVDTAPLPGGRVVYERAGHGPVVVFLHGIGGNRTNWTEQLIDLARDFTCIAWDALGYGDSDDPAPSLKFEHYADELIGLFDHLSVDRAHIVGLSMGGHIALDVASRYSERVATLTLAASSAGMAMLDEEGRQEFVATRLRPLENGVTPGQIAEKVTEILVGRLATPKIRERLRQSLTAIRPKPYMDTVRAIVATDYRAALKSITAPTLVLVGEDDRVLPPPESEFLAAQIPTARLCVLEKAGHLCNIEAAELFNSILVKFLAEYSDRATTL